MSPQRTDNPHAALVVVLAWLIPGAGHVCIGRARRGVIIFLVIGATFWAGVGIGGTLTLDPSTERAWSISEMFAGVHGLVAWYRQDRLYEEIYDEVGPTPAKGSTGEIIERHQYEKDFALAKREQALPYPTNVVARAYAGVAGLLNLLCVFDATALALMGVRGEPRRIPQTNEART